MSGRREKVRRIGTIPEYTRFEPDGIAREAYVTLSVDEFEAIRLIDLLRQSQDEAARRMDVARTTVTAIYERARYKLADALVNGKRLEIEGGNVRLCMPQAQACAAAGIEKGEGIMRIAATYENGEIFQHFGRTEQFKLYDVEHGEIVSAQVVGTNGAGHGALAGFLREHQVDKLICGGIGGGAQTALSGAGIDIYGGVSGSADEAVRQMLAGALAQDSAPNCDHHGEHHHHAGECGDHGCGAHGCGAHGCEH